MTPKMSKVDRNIAKKQLSTVVQYKRNTAKGKRSMDGHKMDKIKKGLYLGNLEKGRSDVFQVYGKSPG